MLAFVFAVPGVAQHKHEPHQSVDMSRVPLLKGVGEIDHPVSASNKQARRFFNQGLALVYGFNHLEAERSFREAQKLDPTSQWRSGNRR